LTLGIVDEFEKRNLKILGPTKLAAEIEGSKVFAKEFMKKYHIPTASFKIFDKPDEAAEFVKSSELPLVIKADGLAAGKGAVVVEDEQTALSTIQKMMEMRAGGWWWKIFWRGRRSPYWLSPMARPLSPCPPLRITRGSSTTTEVPTPAGWGPMPQPRS
jgi:hypothetical protein